jgi:hypothetical protein
LQVVGEDLFRGAVFVRAHLSLLTGTGIPGPPMWGSRVEARGRFAS